MSVSYCSSIRAVLLVRDLKLGGLPKSLLTSSYTYKGGDNFALRSIDLDLRSPLLHFARTSSWTARAYSFGIS